MKKLILFVLLLSAFACGQYNNSTSDQSDKPETEKEPVKEIADKPDNALFDIKAAKIEFKYSGGTEEGTEILYFDDYGAVAVLIDDKKNRFGRTHKTTIWQNKQSIIIDHEKKTVSKTPFRPKATEPPSLADTDEKTRQSIGYEKLANETVAGKNCEVWFNAKQNFKYCLWKKIALKEILGASINKEASAVEQIAEIPSSVREIPKDYKQ